jgi:hypothetical protein
METEIAYTPGDRCRLIGNYRVQHADDCPDYSPGAITDVRTGKRVTEEDDTLLFLTDY